MRKQTTRRSWQLIAVAIVPAAVVLVLVLAQANTLSTAPTSVGSIKGLSPNKTTAKVKAAAHQLAQVNSNRSDALVYGWVAVVVLLGLGIGAVTASRILTPLRVAPETAPGVNPGLGRVDNSSGTRKATVTPGTPDGRVQHDRDRLVDACMDVSDLITNEALRAKLIRALADVGVSEFVVPAETPFDPKQHNGTGTVPTDDRSLDQLVAKTERSGFADRGSTRRIPDVVVYSADQRRTRVG